MGWRVLSRPGELTNSGQYVSTASCFENYNSLFHSSLSLSTSLHLSRLNFLLNNDLSTECKCRVLISRLQQSAVFIVFPTTQNVAALLIYLIRENRVVCYLQSLRHIKFSPTFIKTMKLCDHLHLCSQVLRHLQKVSLTSEIGIYQWNLLMIRNLLKSSRLRGQSTYDKYNFVDFLILNSLVMIDDF